MKLNKKNILDERQEQKLLQIESKGFWLVYWLLLAVLAVQTVIEMTDIISIEIPSFAGEWVVFMIACVYVSIDCMKNNIWDRKLKPNSTTNLIVSIIAGAVSGAIFGIISYLNYHKPIGSIATFVFMMCLTGGICFAVLSFASASYQKNVQKEEARTDDEDNVNN